MKLVLTFVAILTLNTLAQAEALRINVKEDWPSVTLNERKTQDLLSKKSKIYIVDFWASWCEPCLESLPFYVEELKKMNLSDWTLVAINMDTDKNQALDFLKKVPLSTWVLQDEKKQLATKLKVNSLPTLFFIDEKGEVLKTEKGFTKKSKEEFRKNIAEIKKKLG